MRRAPLLQVVNPQQVSSGLQLDRHAMTQVLWEAAANVRFYQGKVRRLIPPATAITLAAGNSRGLSQHQDSSGTRWIWSTTNGAVYRWYGPAAELIHTFTPFYADQLSTRPATYVDFVHWGNWTLMNSGIGAIQRYQPGSGVAALPNAPTDAVQLMKKQNQLFAVGHGANKKQVSWSHADDITAWTPLTTNIAGTLPIEELDTGIRAASRLGPNIACYSEDQLAIVYWVGAPFYYGQRVQLDGIGAVGKYAVCADGPLNYGVSRNGIWRTDGQSYDYIDAGVLSDYLQANVNWDQASKIVAFRNDVTRCIEFHFPLVGSLENNAAWSFDPATGGWSPVPFYQMLMERKLFNKPLAASLGVTYLMDDNPAATAALTLRTKPLLLEQTNGSPIHSGGIIDEVEILAKEATGVEFRHLVAEDIDGPWDGSTWQTLQVDMTTYQLSRRPSGTFHKLEFRSTLANWALDLQGFLLYGAAEGVKRDRL